MECIEFVKFSLLIINFFFLYRDNVKSVFLHAFVQGLSQSVIFVIYSCAYSFGAFLVVEKQTTYDRLFR